MCYINLGLHAIFDGGEAISNRVPLADLFCVTMKSGKLLGGEKTTGKK